MNDVGIRSIKEQESVEARPVLSASPGLGDWLRSCGGCLAFTTYQSARIFFLFPDEVGKTASLERIVGSAMGMAIGDRHLWISNKEQAWRFSNIGARSAGDFSADAVFMPRKGYFLGQCDTHDILADVTFRGERHELLFVNTAFSCIAALDDHFNFRPVWKPNFITALGAGDRCHLNGMGAKDGQLAFATLCGRNDTPLGWKAVKNGGGLVLDVNRDTILCDGLSMPHSPRWHDGMLWLLNSGAGDFGFVDRGRFVPVGLCPGFARGLCFVGGLAVIGVSRLRENTFSAGLPVKNRLESGNIKEVCGLIVIDPATGKLVHWLTIEGVVSELYDVAFLPGILRPFTPGFSLPDLHRVFFDIPEAPYPIAGIVPAGRENLQ